jgi:hypothetical protein
MHLKLLKKAWQASSVEYDTFTLPYEPDQTIGQLVQLAPGTLGWHRLDVTSSVQAWVDGSTANYGFIFDPVGTTGSYTTIRSSGDNRAGLNCCPPMEAGAAAVAVASAAPREVLAGLVPSRSVVALRCGRVDA